MIIEVNRVPKGFIECPVCLKLFKSMGYARHRAIHYYERQKLLQTNEEVK